MQPRNTPPVSLPREAIHVEPRTARYKARHSIRKPRKWKPAAVAAGGAGAIIAITAVGSAAHWAAGAASLTADLRHIPNAGSTGNHSTVTGSSSTAGTPHDPPPARSAAASVAATPAASPSAHPAKAVAKPATTTPASAKPSATKAAADVKPVQKQQAATPAVPYLVYDSVLPTAIPPGNQVATYSDGPFAASSASVAGRGNVLWIDVNGSNTNANALDVEPGDATPAGAAAWVSAKLTHDPSSNAIVYTFKNDWGQVISDIGALPAWMHSHVKYWIADPTGYAHVLPGASATQWYWGKDYDISTAEPGFFG